MNDSSEKVILVDEQDRETGTMEKLRAHQLGVLHRAFSVFVFNRKGEFLLQQRAAGKYHSALCWTNTCCSHPRPGEDVLAAAHRRLMEEMGIDTVLEKKFGFIYKADLDGGITEHEFDHVFVGYSDDEPRPDPSEVASFRWMGKEEIMAEISRNPEAWTPWFKLVMERF